MLNRIAMICAAEMLCATIEPAQAEARDTMVGDIILVAFDFCPQGFVPTDGRSLDINQNQALYSIISNTYGGNGYSTFKVPDLRDRIPIHAGSGNPDGLTGVGRGSQVGQPTAQLNSSTLPSHSHGVHVNADGPNNSISPAGRSLTKITSAGVAYAPVNPLNRIAFSDGSIAPTGDGRAFSLYSPSIYLRYCISMVGDYPLHRDNLR